MGKKKGKLEQLFERVEASDERVEDFGLDGAPHQEQRYLAKGKVVIEADALDELQGLLGSGVLVDGELVVRGHLLLDDDSTLAAKKITCESLKVNECYVSAGSVVAKKYIHIDTAASHGYSVEIDAAKTELLIHDSASIASGPVPLSVEGWKRAATIDIGPENDDVAKALDKDFTGLLKAAMSGTVSDFLEAFDAKQSGYQLAEPTNLKVELVQKEDAPAFSPIGIASDGEQLYVHCNYKLWHADAETEFHELADSNEASASTYDIALYEEAVWIAHSSGIKVTRDNGQSSEELDVPKAPFIAGFAVGPDGSLWAAGGGKPVVITKGAGKGPLRTVAGPTRQVTAVGTCRHGALIGDYGGEIWLGVDGELRRIGSASSTIRAFEETTKGTIVALAGRPLVDDDVEVVRSTDGGKSFESNTVAPSFFTLRQMPGGPLIAAGTKGAVGISYDDGQTFTVIKHKFGKRSDPFSRSCVFQGVVYLGGKNNNLVRVVPSKAKPKKSKSATKSKSTKSDAASESFVHLEFVGDGSSKFWDGKVTGSSLAVCYGRIGSKGQEKIKNFDSEEDAKAALTKQSAAKRKKGYE